MSDKPTGLLKRLDKVHRLLEEYGERYKHQLDVVHPKQRRSAMNFVHYLALRSRDTRDLQDELAAWGLSRLGGAESHVQASLHAVEVALHALSASSAPKRLKPIVSLKKGRNVLRRNANALLGKKLKRASTRIMVTQPSEAATDSRLAQRLVEAGMNIARINCAHDQPDAWRLMIDNIANARGRTGRGCRVAMDLAGPKIRTSRIRPGQPVARLRTKKDVFGRIVRYPRVLLSGSGEFAPKGNPVILPVAAELVEALRPGDSIRFDDARGKHRTLTVEGVVNSHAHAVCNGSAYITSRTVLTLERDEPTFHTVQTILEELPAVEQAITLATGDDILLTREPTPGESAARGESGEIDKPAHVSCTLPAVLDTLKVGEPVSFDDGRFNGFVSAIDDDGVLIHLVYVRGGAGRLRADKGINFPRSQLALGGLTVKDRGDLAFIAEHGDIVSLSFVNSPDDVRDLLRSLEQYDVPDLGIILKIETMAGYHHLPDILLEAMKHHPVGVMLARGDLAVEAGWKRLAQVQEEIMRMCEAAHMPVVWATQVLENLAKTGLPSRAEITDVAMAERAECVMLNKGPHILAAIRLLDQLLSSMEDYQEKTSAMKPSLELRDDWANISYEGVLPADLISAKQ